MPAAPESPGISPSTASEIMAVKTGVQARKGSARDMGDTFRAWR
jgi:hypothetical protein